MIAVDKILRSAWVAMSDPDRLTTIAGAVPPLIQLGIAFGLPVTDVQRDAILGVSLAVIGYYTAKKNQIL